MIFENIEDFVDHMPTKGALMGLDLGTKTIGIAVSDLERTVATGIKTIKRTKFQLDLKILLGFIGERNITGLVLGLPKNMNGTEGPRCQSTRTFARNIFMATATIITFWDERLSTVAAERSLLQANASRKRRAEVIDHVAASFILQGALDRLAIIKTRRLNS